MQTVSYMKTRTNNGIGCVAGLMLISLQTLIQEDRITASTAGSPAPSAAPSTRRWCAAQRGLLRTLTEAHTSRRSSVFRGTPENVGRQGQRQAASGHGSRRRAAAAAGASPHAQGGNAPLFDDGKAGGQRRADALRQGLPHLTDPASLQGKNAGKQAEGTGTTENGKQPAAQKKRTRTTSQATTTQTSVADPLWDPSLLTTVQDSCGWQDDDAEKDV